MSDKPLSLLQLAQREFGEPRYAGEKELAPVDEKLFRAVADGEFADYSAASEQDNDPAKANTWGPERVLKVDRIIWLCTDRQASVLVTYRGIRIKGARIEGKLDLRHAKIPYPLIFEKNAFPDRIDLRSAEIRELSFPGTHTGPIDADELKVSGSLKLSEGFRAAGEVRLHAAAIGGSLSCAGGQFINEEAQALIDKRAKARGDERLNALSLNRLKVDGSVFLDKNFRAVGEVRLVNATVGGYLHWKNVSSPENVTLDLRSTRVGTLWDDKKSWPDLRDDDVRSWGTRGRLLLHGFVYDEIDDRAPTDARTRIDWLGRQPPGQFWPQPYEQLSRVLRNSGRDKAAKEVLIAKEKNKARSTRLTWSERLWYHFFGRLIVYGYRPQRAFWIGLLIVLLPGWSLFGMGWHEDIEKSLVTPAKSGAYASDAGGQERRLSEEYPNFSALMYSLDVFVPVINLHQAEYWLPNANRGRVLVNYPWFTLRTGGLLRGYLWFHIVAGWTLSTLWVVGLTGLVRRG